MSPQSPAAPAKTYLTANQVRARYGNVSVMWITRKLASDATFPKPVKFGRLRFWDSAALDAWERLKATAA